MKIVVFGAGGHVGQAVVDEARGRGHEVTAVTHREADVLDAASVASVASGHDVAISAVGPGESSGATIVRDCVRPLLDGLSRAGVPRLIVVGGAGSLEVAPGVRLVDTPGFHEEWKPIALAHADALDAYRAADTDVAWSYVSPAALLEPGERTGGYRVGGDRLLTDAEGNSRISTADFAIALIDEAEHGEHVRERFTVAH